VSGDLTQEGLGLSDENRRLITESCSVIINCAASIDFDLVLDESIEINIRGALRMQQLAKECKNLKSFCHVSTCYVNSDDIESAKIDRMIPEKIVRKEFDAEELFSKLSKLTSEEL